MQVLLRYAKDKKDLHVLYNGKTFGHTSALVLDDVKFLHNRYIEGTLVTVAFEAAHIDGHFLEHRRPYCYKGNIIHKGGVFQFTETKMAIQRASFAYISPKKIKAYI